MFRENCRQAGSNPVAKSLSHELPCSGVLEGDGLDLTTEKCVLLFHPIECRVQPLLPLSDRAFRLPDPR